VLQALKFCLLSQPAACVAYDNSLQRALLPFHPDTAYTVYCYVLALIMQGLILLHEHLNLWGVLGSLLIAAGVLLVSSRQKQPAATAKHGSAAAGSTSKANCSSEPVGGPPGAADAQVVVVELPELPESIGKKAQQATGVGGAAGVPSGPAVSSGSTQHAEVGHVAADSHGHHVGTVDTGQPGGHTWSEDASDVQCAMSESQALLEGECPSSPALPQIQGRGIGKGAVLARLLGHTDSRVVVHQAGLWREQLRTQYDPDSPRLPRLTEQS
jgi:hypothetical protein